MLSNTVLFDPDRFLYITGIATDSSVQSTRNSVHSTREIFDACRVHFMYTVTWTLFVTPVEVSARPVVGEKFGGDIVCHALDVRLWNRTEVTLFDPTLTYDRTFLLARAGEGLAP